MADTPLPSGQVVTAEHESGIAVTVTRSAGSDGAVVILIDTTSDDQDLRVLLNDEPVYFTREYEP